MKKFPPLVSVITPCYNDAKHIMECVESVQKSDYSNFEHIIVDDGSDKRTKEVLAGINFANVFIISQNNQGVCGARNEAIRRASGIYILPVDSDDRIAPEYISKAVALFERNERVRIVTSEITQFFGNSHAQLVAPSNFNMGELLSRNLFHISTFFRRCDALEIGGFDEDFNKGLEDWAFWVSLLEMGGEVGVIPGTNTFYMVKRHHRNNSFSAIEMRQFVKLIWEKHKHLYSLYYADPYQTDSYIALKARNDLSWSKLTIFRIKRTILGILDKMYSIYQVYVRRNRR